MTDVTPGMIFANSLCGGRPDAVAWIRGNAQNPQLNGLVKFFSTPYTGVLIEAEIFGLPNIALQFSSDFYAMHIHEKGDCTLPFDQVENHYNPTKEPHPQHAGDLLPLMGNQGYAWLAFYDKRFTIPEVLDRSVIIHRMTDDFQSQPSGNAGDKIGCGVIRNNKIE